MKNAEVTYQNYLNHVNSMDESDVWLLNENITESKLEPLTETEFNKLIEENTNFLYLSNILESQTKNNE